jgi:hypothetical protein
MSENAIDNMLPISSTRTKKKKYVTFHKIEIIELAFTIGDNPSVSNGVPLTLEWVAQKRTVMAVDFFETYRPARCPSTWQLRIREASRVNILLESGYTQQEIDAAAKDAMMIRRLRRVSRRHSRQQYDDGDEPDQDTEELLPGSYAKLVEVEQDEEPQPQTTKEQLKESSDMEGPLVPFPAHCDDDALLLVGMTFEAVVARSA